MVKKILVVTAFPPCEKTAGQDYTRRLIVDLVSRNYEVDLIYASYPQHEVKLPQEVNIKGTIEPTLMNCAKHIKWHPFFTKRFDFKMLKYIKSIANNYDLLYFDFSQVHLYSFYIEHRCKVLMSHDVICQKYNRKSGKVNVEWIKKSESKISKSGKYVFTFSSKDCSILRDSYGIGSTPVNFYLKNEQFEYCNYKIDNDKFCFYGAWNRSENSEALVYFLDNVMEKIDSSVEFVVIGGGVSDELRSRLNTYTNFKLLGFVDDPISEIAKCQALIAPLHQGAGVKVKVVDALTSGTPVIGTDVAFEGLEDNENKALFYRATDAEEFAKILSEWKSVDTEYKQLAANEFCNRYNKNHFPDWLGGINS